MCPSPLRRQPQGQWVVGPLLVALALAIVAGIAGRQAAGLGVGGWAEVSGIELFWWPVLWFPIHLLWF